MISGLIITQIKFFIKFLFFHPSKFYKLLFFCCDKHTLQNKEFIWAFDPKSVRPIMTGNHGYKQHAHSLEHESGSSHLPMHAESRESKLEVAQSFHFLRSSPVTSSFKETWKLPKHCHQMFKCWRWRWGPRSTHRVSYCDMFLFFLSKTILFISY